MKYLPPKFTFLFPRIQYIGQKSLGSLFKIGEGILVHNAKTTSIERVLQEEKGFLVMDNGGSGGLTPAFGEGEEVDEGLEQFGGEESVVFFVNVFGKEEASFLLFSLFGVDDFGGGNSGKVQERNLEDKKNESLCFISLSSLSLLLFFNVSI